MILRWLNRSYFSHKAIGKIGRIIHEDTPGKFVLLKELNTTNSCQIFFVDNFYFCSFVAENERLNQQINRHN